MTLKAVAAIGLTTVLAWTTAGAQEAPQPDGPRPTGPCADFGQVHQICGLGSPEDLAVLAGSPWLMISEQAPLAGLSGMAALDTRSGRIVRFSPEALASSGVSAQQACAAPQAKVALGGMGVRRAGNGWRLAIIHHGETDSVQLFDVSLKDGAPRLSWRNCATAPPPLFLNDITVLPGGAIAATHMYDRALAAKAPKAQLARYLAGKMTGYVVRWSQAAGWAKIANSDGAFPNGIESSADGRTIYFAETYGHRVNALGVDGAGRRSIAVAMQPDNVTRAADGRVIVAGGTGAPVTSTQGCAALRPVGCGFPSAIDRLDFAAGTATPLFADDGTSVPGASVAVALDHTLYVGTSFGDRITVAPLPVKPSVAR
jgi:sugar lactone lactonase YvrE